MKINYIELVGYKRIILNNIKKFRFTANSRKILILGTNGSGKSSLISELSPLPANSSNYNKHGYKEISITHNGSSYILKSSFANGQSHSFIKDGEELNKGGTITVQKELVLIAFGIDQDIHDLVTGVEKFTSMAPARRRWWITKLCDANYDYALKMYSKFMEKQRDITGALKIAKKKLVTESSKVIDDSKMIEFEQSIKNIVRAIDELYQLKSENENDSRTVEEYLNSYQQQIVQQSEIVQSIIRQLRGAQVFTPDEIMQDIDDVKQKITSNQTKTSLLSKEVDELKKAQEVYTASGSSSVDELQNKLTSALNWRSNELSKINPEIVFTNPKIAYESLESIYDLLENIFNNIPENSDRRFSPAVLNNAIAEYDVITEKILKAQRAMDQLVHQKQHLDSIRSGDSTVCPKCNHSWHIGYSQSVYDKITQQIDKGNEFLTVSKKKQSDLNEIINKNKEYRDIFKDYARCIGNYSSLKPFWDFIDDNEYIYTKPRFCKNQLDKIKFELSVLASVEDINTEITKINDHLTIAKKASDQDMGKVKTRIDAIELELGTLTKEYVYLNKNMSELKNTHKLITTLLDTDAKLKKLTDAYYSGIIDLMKVVRNEFITDNIYKLQSELAVKQQYINTVNIQKGIIADIQSSVDKLTKEEMVYKLLVSSLSPTDGLIAEGLLGFIKNYVRKMNTLISKAWTYKLEIMDCQVENDITAELDYKFPMLVKDEPEPVPDISKGSDGMKQIIDLSFKIVAMHYLRMGDYPIFLDEPSSGMDAGHKKTVVNLINYLADHLSFSQFYIITHDYSQYGALTNSDTCVLCSDNIVVPSSYNENVIIE